MAERPREYILGTDPAELERLGLQHRLWAEQAHAAWERAAIRPGLRVLDVGCGPGFAALDLARIVGSSGLVTGVDESDAFIDYARTMARTAGVVTARFHTGDVQDLADAGVEPDAYDLAWARWVLCFVQDPAAVVRSVARALAPGGRFVVFDYFNYEHTMTLAPRSAPYARIVRAAADSWRARGGDPDIVGRLPRLMREAGLEVERIVPVQRTARPTETMWHWPGTFWPIFGPKLVAGGFLTQEEYDAFREDWARAEQNPSTFVVMPTVYEVCARKPSPQRGPQHEPRP